MPKGKPDLEKISEQFGEWFFGPDGEDHERGSAEEKADRIVAKIAELAPEDRDAQRWIIEQWKNAATSHARAASALKIAYRRLTRKDRVLRPGAPER